MLRCSCCGQQVHPACLVPPWMDLIPDEWSCYSCKEKTDEYLQARDAYIAELLKRCVLEVVMIVVVITTKLWVIA